MLIIGSGVAGCTAALTLADAGHDVLLINAGEDLADGNSELAQGGIIYRAAPSTAIPDDARALEKDILVAGHDYNYRKAVRYLCRQGPRCVERMLMERAGVEFDRNPDGSFNLTREGGHAAPRILHRADYSGKAIMDGLTAQVRKHPRITRLHRRAAIDLLTSHHQARTSQYRYEVGNRCLGAYVLNEESGEPETILADWTVLATGGVGQVFLHSTNTPGCVGTSVSMAFRAGVALANLEFMQFHPTALYEERTNRRSLITEAMRGEGARLLDQKGHAFMRNYDPRGDLAPRDVVAQAMMEEMLHSGAPCLFLDVSCVKQDLPTRFPTVFETCRQAGIDIRKEPIPVVPAAHYFCGGVLTDINGRTSMRGLYAVGECACTGLHGAQPSGQHVPSGGLGLGHELRPRIWPGAARPSAACPQLWPGPSLTGSTKATSATTTRPWWPRTGPTSATPCGTMWAFRALKPDCAAPLKTCAIRCAISTIFTNAPIFHDVWWTSSTVRRRPTPSPRPPCATAQVWAATTGWTDARTRTTGA